MSCNAGSAPGLVAGVYQVNIQIPDGTPSGNVSIAIVQGQGPAVTYSHSNLAVAVQ